MWVQPSQFLIAGWHLYHDISTLVEGSRGLRVIGVVYTLKNNKIIIISMINCQRARDLTWRIAFSTGLMLSIEIKC